MSEITAVDMTTSSAGAEGPLSREELERMNAYWRAAKHLSVGQIYLKDNPLLDRPLTLDNVKPRLLGHWGTTPGLNFLYVHWYRIIRERDTNMIYVICPGHGGPALMANTYLEGSYSEIYPTCTRSRSSGISFTRPRRGEGLPEIRKLALGSASGCRVMSVASRRTRQPPTRKKPGAPPWLLPG